MFVGDDACIVPWALTLLHTIKFNVVLCPTVGGGVPDAPDGHKNNGTFVGDTW